MRLRTLAFFLVPVLLMISCAKPQIPQYVDFTNFTIENLGMSESVVSADLKYYNQNKFAIQLKKVDVDVYMSDRLLGHTLLDTLIEIHRLDTFYVPVKIKVDMRNLLSNALTALLFNEVNVKIQGTAKLGKSGFFMSVPVFYEGKQKVNL